MSKTFGFESTTDEVLDGVDLTGKRILVTGVSAGLGVETARALVAHGAQVVGAARDLDKARRATAAVAELAKKSGGFELIALDLASLASVRAAADALVAAGKPFDVVIANAGVMMPPKGETADGFETQFGTNHLGHFVFVNRIAGLMKPGVAPGQSVLGRPPLFRRRPRRSELRANALRPDRRLWPLQDRQHPVRRRVRPAPQGRRHPRHSGPSRRHPDRTRAAYDAGASRRR